MDEADRELLRLLRLDGRRSASDLAQDLGVSRPTVQNRIGRLKANGTITRFTVELAPEAEAAMIDALVLIRMAALDSRPTIAKLQRLSEVSSISTINGAYDLLLEIRASSLQRLDAILMDVRRMQGVEETNSSIRLARFK